MLLWLPLAMSCRFCCNYHQNICIALVQLKVKPALIQGQFTHHLTQWICSYSKDDVAHNTC